MFFFSLPPQDVKQIKGVDYADDQNLHQTTCAQMVAIELKQAVSNKLDEPDADHWELR